MKRLYKHKISQMEKVMPSFEYEPLVMSPELETLDDITRIPFLFCYKFW
jgi:hypothetical protein